MFLAGTEERRQAVGYTARQQPDVEQHNRPHRLSRQRLAQRLPPGQKTPQCRYHRHDEQQTQYHRIDEDLPRAGTVTGHLAHQVHIQTEVGDDVEPEIYIDRRVEATGARRPQDAGRQRGEGQVNGPVEEVDDDGSDGVLRHPPDGACVVLLTVEEAPQVEPCQEQGHHPGDETDERAHFHAVGAVLEAHCPCAWLFQQHAAESAVYAVNEDLLLSVFTAPLRPHECLPAGEVGVGQHQPFGSASLHINFDLVDGIAGHILSRGGPWLRRIEIQRVHARIENDIVARVVILYHAR